MDFKLSKTHLLQQELFRKFAETEVKPLARDMDESEVYSMELVQKMQKCGFFGIPFPKELGGAGADVLTYALCIEEMSKQDGSTGITLSVHTSLCASGIYENGNDAQKEKYLRPLIDGRKVGCYSLTEPNAGSDASGLQTRAYRDGDFYILNGSKVFTTNSGFADTFLVFAVTDPTKGTRGISAFIVEREFPGLSVSANIQRMGIRAASNCLVSYDNVQVPAENLVGKEGDGFKIAMKCLDGGRIGIAAQALGLAEGAFNEAVKYVQERKQFGRTIASFQNTQFKLAELQTKIEAARGLVYKAAVMKDNHESYSVAAAMAKYYASEMANDVTRACVQLLGGYGFTREYPVERMMRDAKITEIYEGTSEVMKMVIAGGLRLK